MHLLVLSPNWNISAWSWIL